MVPAVPRRVHPFFWDERSYSSSSLLLEVCLVETVGSIWQVKPVIVSVERSRKTGYRSDRNATRSFRVYDAKRHKPAGRGSGGWQAPSGPQVGYPPKVGVLRRASATEWIQSTTAADSGWLYQERCRSEGASSFAVTRVSDASTQAPSLHPTQFNLSRKPAGTPAGFLRLRSSQTHLVRPLRL